MSATAGISFDAFSAISFALGSTAILALNTDSIVMALDPFRVEFTPDGGVNKLTSDGEILTSDGVELTW